MADLSMVLYEFVFAHFDLYLMNRKFCDKLVFSASDGNVLLYVTILREYKRIFNEFSINLNRKYL